ncbi:hypothetical protein WJX77_002493 [Trebouxia sp. C0004]
MWARLKSSLRKSELLDGAGADADGTQTGSHSSDTSVRVAVRARPLVAKERASGARPCILTEEGRARVTVGQDRVFTFDHVFGPTAKQEQVYRHCVQPLVEGFFAGYNATVFAYGQTGSGKTHTMGTSGEVAGAEEEEQGITPRVIRQLFEGIEAQQENLHCSVRIMFLEIHNEEVKDLLHPDTPARSIAIRETSDGQIIIAGAQDVPAQSHQEAIRLLEIGSLSRATGCTLMNEQSSRSHAIFSLVLEQQPPDGSPGDFVTAKFHLVDLAGSERAKKTGAAGKQLKESVGINAGLLALGNVISALGDPKKRPSHVPYRDSKLTRLLQDSLGGNSRTLMVACVTTADTYLEESLNTLKYANRARDIKNKPKINRERAGHMQGLQGDLQHLQVQLVQRQLAEPSLALSPALLYGDLTPWAGDSIMLGMLRDVANGKVPAEELSLMSGGASELKQQLSQAQQHSLDQQLQIQRLNEELAEQQASASQQSHRAAAMLSALDELQERREVSDSARGRLRSILSAPLENFSVGTSGAVSGGGVRSSGLIRQGSRLSGSFRGAMGSRGGWLGSPHEPQLQEMQANISELEGNMRAKDQQLLKAQDSLREAQEDLARDEVIFAGKVKELQELREANEQLQAANLKQAARHTKEVEELLMELSKQNAAAQAALPHTPQGLSGDALPLSSQGASGTALPQGQNADEPSRSLTPLPPRLTTPASPSRRPSTHTRVFHTPPPEGCSGTPQEAGAKAYSVLTEQESLRAERGRSFSNSHRWGSQQAAALDIMGMAGGVEEGDQVVFGGVPTRPSSASTTGRSNIWEVDSTGASMTDSLARVSRNPEHAQLLSEHRRLEKGRRELENQALRESRHYSAQQQSLDKQLRECVYNIRDKEGLIAALKRNDLQAKQLSQQYLERLQELEGQMAVKERELQRLKAELEAIDSDRARTEEEKKKMRAAFEEKVAAVQRHMVQLQKQLKEGEAAKKEKARSKHQIKALEEELGRMKTMQEALNRKIKASNEVYEREASARQLEVGQLRKTGEAHRKRVKLLEQELASQRIITKRKTDEASVLQKRLHHLALESEGGRDKAQAYASNLTPGGSKPRTPGGYRTPGKGKKNNGMTTPNRQAGTPAGGTPRVSMTGGKPSQRYLADLQAVVDKEVQQLLVKKEAEDQLAILQQRREALHAERDDKQQQRSQLELQILRYAQKPGHSALRASNSATQLSRHGHEGSRISRQEPVHAAPHASSSQAEDEGPQCSQQQGESYGLSHEHSKHAELESDLEPENREEEEVRIRAAALDDVVDTCDAQLQYLDSAVAECQTRCAEADTAAAQLRQQAELVGAEEARTMLQQLVGHVVTQKDKGRRAAAKAAELEAVLAERTQQMSEAETTLKLKEMEFERRFTKLQKEHAVKVATVLHQVAAVVPADMSADTAAAAQGVQEPEVHNGGAKQGSDVHQLLKLYKEEREQLSKDVLYYKQSCKDLKRRLKAETSMHSDSETVLSEVSNQSEAYLQQRQTSPRKGKGLVLSGQNIWLPQTS